MAAKTDPASDVASRLLATSPDDPLRVLWDALHDDAIKGPDVAIAIILHPSCGINRKSGNLSMPHARNGRSLFDGNTPILAATQADRLDVVQRLLQLDASVNSQNTLMFTPLHIAATNNNICILETLLAQGANVTARDHRDRTPLHAAANCGDANALMTENLLPMIVRLVESGADLEARDNFGFTPLNLAALEGHTAAVQTLLALGANLTTRSSFGYSPLHTAAKNSHLTVLNFLLSRSALIEAKNAAGHTPLHTAVEACSLAATRALIHAGASMTTIDDWNDALLNTSAAQVGSRETILYLLSEGADVNAASPITKRTPLHAAADEGRFEYVQALLDAGADIEALDINGRSALSLYNRTNTLGARVLRAEGAKL